MKKETKRELFWILVMIVIALLTSCGSTKTVTESDKKEKTDIELTDNSTINTKIEQEKQYLNTNTKERIVTYYGVRFDTIREDGKETIIGTPYPLKTEEERNIQVQQLLNKLSKQDSMQNAIELKYENDLKEKDKQISEFKETKTLYHIALITLGVGLIILLLFLRR